MLRGIPFNDEQRGEILTGIAAVLSEDPDLRFAPPLRLDRSLETWTLIGQRLRPTRFLYHHLANPGLGASSLREEDDFRIVEVGTSLTTQQRIADALGSLDSRMDGEVRMLTIPHLHLEALEVKDDSGPQLIIVIRDLKPLHETLAGLELPAEKFLTFARDAPSFLGLGFGQQQLNEDTRGQVLALLK